MSLSPADSNFPLFSPLHLTIVAAIPAAAGGLAWVTRAKPHAASAAGRLLGVFLVLNELVWYVYRYSHEGLHFPAGLPLQLCDMAVWITALAALLRTQSPAFFDLAWYWGLAGAGMAVLTPDLWDPFPSYPSLYFFAAHGGVVATVLFLVWSKQAKPRPGSWWKAFLAVNVYAAAVGAFNAAFKTNYLYLCNRPAHSSILDLFGPWPVYLLAAEPLALLLFWLLWLPFRRYGIRRL
jgi:hypothetical integral membrane protein (TIGR02206 family)